MSLSVEFEKVNSPVFAHQVCGAAQACVFWRGLELHCALEPVTVLGSQWCAVTIHTHRLGRLPYSTSSNWCFQSLLNPPTMIYLDFSARPHATLQKPRYFLWLWIRGWKLGDQQRLGKFPALPLFGEQPGGGENPHDWYLQKLHLQCVSSSAPGS